MMMEVIGHALGFQSLSSLKERVALTLRSLVGRTPGVAIARDVRGFVPHFIDAATGGHPAPSDSSCLMCSGLMMSGALFARSYVTDVDPSGSHEINELVSALCLHAPP
jgi:hypothetical protein